MNKLKITPFLFVCLFQFSYAQKDGDLLFAPEVLHEIRIEGLSYSQLQNQFFDDFGTGGYTYLPGKVRIDGILIDSVGVRVKGGSSAFEPKQPLKFDFNKFRPRQTYDGVKKVNLHNFFIDTTFQRELITYDIMRTGGLKAPRTAFARVFLNHQFQGVYGLVEQVDKNFLRNYFADDEGTLIKTGQGGIELKSDTGSAMIYDDLKNFVASMSPTMLVDTIEKVLDVDALLRQMILQSMTNTVDNLFTVDWNFYLYQEPKSGLQYFIPWDFNLSFFPWADFPINQLPANQVAAKILQIPKFQIRYYQLACEMLEYNFTPDRFYKSSS